MSIDDQFSLIGDTMVELPSYMNSLTQKEADEVLYGEMKDRIVACGIHKESKNLVLLDENKSLLEVNLNSFFSYDFDVLSAKPIIMGTRVELTLENIMIEVDAADLLNASNALNMSNIEIDM